MVIDDVFGAALLGGAKEIFVERHDGLIWTDGLDKYRHGDLTPWQLSAMEELQGRNVLDVGFGLGRYAPYYKGLGIDTSKKLVDYGFARGYNVVECDLNDLSDKGYYGADTLLMIGPNFPLFGTVGSFRNLDDSPITKIVGEGIYGRKLETIKIRLRYQNLATHYFPYLIVESLEEVIRGSDWKIKSKEYIDENRFWFVLEASA